MGPIEELALKIQLISQETLRASLSAWLDFWTYLIVLGVALEIIDWVWEYASDLKDFGRGVIHTPEKPSFVKFFIGLTAIALVVTGVAGEWYLQIRIGEAESKIERIADSLEESTSSKLRDTVRDVGDTKAAAVRANDEAGRAKQRADKIGKQADELTVKLTAAETAQLAERKKVLDMEVWLSPRVLPMIEEPRGLTWERIKYYSGINANINSVVDEESRRAAGQIAAVIRKAGWNIVGLTSDSNRQVTLTDNLGMTQMADGVTVLSHRTPKSGVVGTSFDESRSKEAAGVLSDLLEDNGWDVVAVPGDPDPNARLWVPPNTVRIEVGLKPNPYISPNLPKNIQEQRKKIIEQDRQAREERHRAREHERQIQEKQWLLFHPLAPSPVVPHNPKPEK